MNRIFTYLMLLFSSYLGAAQMYHQAYESELGDHSLIWEQHTKPFDECIVTWNSNRPVGDAYQIDVAVYVDGVWSPYYGYAYWGTCTEQFCYESKDSVAGVTVDQDTIFVDSPASGFRVRIISANGSGLGNIRALHASTRLREETRRDTSEIPNGSVHLPVPEISQFGLGVPHGGRLCSPTSTMAVICYLLRGKGIEVSTFAELARDTHSDIYGNWVLNVAQACHELGENWEGCG